LISSSTFSIFAKENQVDFNWALHIGNTGSDEGRGIAQDSMGNIVVTGLFRGNVDFDPSQATHNLNSRGSDDIFVASYDSAGNLNWANSFGSFFSDAGFAIATDSSGNILVTGVFQGIVDFDPGPDIENLTSAIDSSIFMARFSAAGDLNWAHGFGSRGLDAGFAIATDGASNVLLTGSFSGRVDFDPNGGTPKISSGNSNDIFVASYDSAGKLNWVNSFGSVNFDGGEGIIATASGNILVTGFFGDKIDFDPSSNIKNLESKGAEDIFVASFSSTGDLNWAHSFGSSASDFGFGIATDESGDTLITGNFNGLVDFDPTSSFAELSSSGDSDIFVASYDTSGNFNWAHGIGGTGIDSGLGISTDLMGNIYLTGRYSDSADFDPSEDTIRLTSRGDLDIYIASFELDGSFNWAHSFGDTGEDSGFGIATDGVGNLTAIGKFGGSIDFDPNIDEFALLSNGNEDGYIVSLNQSSADN
jgi:hypothetical protein